MKHSFNLLYFIYLYLSLTQTSKQINLPKIRFEAVRYKEKSELMEMQSQLSHVLVQTQYSWSPQNSRQYQKLYIALHSNHRQKKVGYKRLKQNHVKMAKTLTRQRIIPNIESLIHSAIHQKYLRKKKQWSFTQYYVIIYRSKKSYEDKSQVQKIMSKIAEFHPQKIKTNQNVNKKIINYLNEKQLAMQAFLSAKQELQQFMLKHFQGNYKIVATKDIQFQSNQLANIQFLEDHIEYDDSYARKEQFHSSSKQQTQSLDDIIIDNSYLDKTTDQNPQTPKNVNIKVLFQIAENSFDIEEYYQQIDKMSDDEEESVSDYDSDSQNMENVYGQHQEF